MPFEFVTARGGSAQARRSPVTLVGVILAHLGALVALASSQIAPPLMPPQTLMVEMLSSTDELRKSQPIKPLKPAPTTTKSAAVAAQNPPQRLLEAPVLATENSLAATRDVPQVEKTLAQAATPSTQPPARPAAVAAAEPSVPRFDAGYLENPAPAYPPLSRRAGEEGKVVLKVYVEASGLTGKVEIQKASGFERLDKSALAAVSRWKFVPAKQGTEAVPAWVLVPIIFSLKA